MPDLIEDQLHTDIQHPAPAAFLFSAMYVLPDGEPVKTMAGIMQRCKVAP